MEITEIATKLEALNLDEDEAQVYLRLLQAGPAKVSQISSYVELSRSTLYRTLDDLVEKGFVTKSLGRPTVYGPQDPETVFQLGANQLKNQLDHLEQVRENVLDDLEQMKGTTTNGDSYHWKRLEGTNRVYSVIHKLAQEADQRIEGASNEETCKKTWLPVVEQAWQILAKRAEDVDVRLMLGYDDPASYVPGEDSGGIEMRGLEADETLHFLLFDRSELVLVVRPAGPKGLSEEEAVAIWTDAPSVVSTHVELVDRMWPEAEAVA